MAILKALEISESTQEMSGKKLRIYSDSEYSINVITKWMSSWKSKGWTKRDGKKIANIDIIEALHQKMAETRSRLGRGAVVFEHVKGHSDDPGNDAADKLARKGSGES